MPPSITTKQQEVFEIIYARLHHLPPIGYKTDLPNLRFLVDEPAAAFVRRAFDLVSSGERIDEVRETLTNDGFKTPVHGKIGGNPVSRKSFYNMLNDPFYAGYLRDDDQFCKGFHEPLVTTKEFVKVQQTMAKRRKNWVR
jgi:hypothetical protein